MRAPEPPTHKSSNATKVRTGAAKHGLCARRRRHSEGVGRQGCHVKIELECFVLYPIIEPCETRVVVWFWLREQRFRIMRKSTFRARGDLFFTREAREARRILCEWAGLLWHLGRSDADGSPMHFGYPFVIDPSFLHDRCGLSLRLTVDVDRWQGRWNPSLVPHIGCCCEAAG